MTKSLADKYIINTRYQRSARIDTDWKNDVVSGYVLHGTARNVIKRIAEQISDQKKPQKSFTLHCSIKVFWLPAFSLICHILM